MEKRITVPCKKCADRNARGHVIRGSKVSKAVLTEGVVRALRTLKSKGLSCRAAASQLGVKYPTAFNVWHGQTWFWVDGLYAEAQPKNGLRQKSRTSGV
jgi:hypothetical protein